MKIKSNFLTLSHEPSDSKIANFRHNGDEIIIESVTDYLSRVEFDLRSPAILVSILINPSNPITYTFARSNMDTELRNYVNKYYAFIGGIRDEDFKEVIFNSEVSSQQIYSRSYGETPNRITIYYTKNELDEETIINTFIN